MKNEMTIKPTLAFLTSLLASASGANVYDQAYDGTSSGVVSQSITDQATQSMYAFDEFVVPGGTSVSQVIARGIDGGNAGLTTGTHIRISAAPTWSPSGAVFQQDFAGGGNLVEGILTFNIGAFLNGGTYWLSVWIDRPSSGGEWLWKQTTPVTGVQGFVQNPGGGRGFGSSVIQLSDLPGAQGPRDLSFQMTYFVLPEPSTIFGVGLACCLMFLRKRRV